MTTLTAYNEQVIKWTKKPNEEVAKAAKKERMELFEEKFDGIFEKSFTNTRKYVLDEIIYKSVETGVYSAMRSTIANNCEVSTRTVERTVDELKASGQFIVAYGANGHKSGYIFIDRLHKNFKSVMLDLFPEDAAEYIKSSHESELESKPLSSLENAEIADTPMVETAKTRNPLDLALSSFSFKQASNNNIYKARVSSYAGKEPKTKDQKQKDYVDQWATNENQKVLFNRIKACEVGLLPCINEQAHIIALRIGDKATPSTVIQAMDILVDLTERKLNHTLMLNCKLDATTVVKVFHGQLIAKQSRKPVQAKVEPKKHVLGAPLYNWLEEKAEQVVMTITQHPLLNKFFDNSEVVDDLPF